MIRVHVFFSGHVQGVGFRYTTRNLAKELGLLGWVKNLPNGQVEMMVEGPQDKIDQLMEVLQQHFEGMIRQTEKNQLDPRSDYEDFSIRH